MGTRIDVNKLAGEWRDDFEMHDAIPKRREDDAIASVLKAHKDFANGAILQEQYEAFLDHKGNPRVQEARRARYQARGEFTKKLRPQLDEAVRALAAEIFEQLDAVGQRQNELARLCSVFNTLAGDHDVVAPPVVQGFADSLRNQLARLQTLMAPTRTEVPRRPRLTPNELSGYEPSIIS